MDLQKMGTELALDVNHDRGKWRAVVNAVLNHRVPLNAEKCLTS